MTLAARCVVIACLLGGAVDAGVIWGPEGRELLEQYRDDFSGQFIDFTHGEPPMPTDRRLDDEFEESHGVVFSTFQNPNLQLIGPHNVYVSATVSNRIVGTPSSFSADDGRYPYQVEFNEPQRYAGIFRLWNNTVTEFYNFEGVVLGSITNTDGGAFNAFVAPGDDPLLWVSRLVMTGLEVGGSRQVGYSDDLFFGVTIPEPVSAGVWIGLGAALLALRARRKRIQSI